MTKSSPKEGDLDSLLTSIPAAVYRCKIDRYWTMQYISDGIKDISGYNAEDFIKNKKRTYESIIYQEDRPKVRKQINAALKKKDIYSVDYRIIDKLGNVKWFKGRGRGIFRANKPVCLAGIVTDITDTKIIEEGLRKSESTYKTLVEGAKQSIFIVNKDGVFQFMNSAAAHALGKKQNECIGRTMWEIFPKQIADKQMSSIRSVIKTGKYFIGGSQVNFGGHERVYETNIQPLKNPDGTVDSVISIAVDVTDYQETRSFLKEIIDGTSIPSLVIDKNHTVTHWNKAMEKLTGHNRNEIINSKKQWKIAYSKRRPILADFVLEGDIDSIKIMYRDVQKKSELLEGAYEGVSYFPTMKGGAKWLLFTAAPLKDSEGKIIGAIETAQDITLNKNAEKELLKSKQDIEAAYEKLKELDNMKDDFLNMVAHELKTPLIPIMGYLSILQRDKSLPPEYSKMIGICMRAAIRENEIIKEIMDVHRLDSHMMKFEFKKLDLSELISTAVSELDSSAKQKGLNLSAEVSVDLPKIYGDSQRIMQVITNLIINAIKFTSAGHIKVKAKREMESIKITVEDTGIGISEKDLPKLFTRFFQANPGTKRHYEGTGLGLVICKGIIEAHRGNIQVESELGRGARFILTIPIKMRNQG